MRVCVMRVSLCEWNAHVNVLVQIQSLRFVVAFCLRFLHRFFFFPMCFSVAHRASSHFIVRCRIRFAWFFYIHIHSLLLGSFIHDIAFYLFTLVFWLGLLFFFIFFSLLFRLLFSCVLWFGYIICFCSIRCWERFFLFFFLLNSMEARKYLRNLLLNWNVLNNIQ